MSYNSQGSYDLSPSQYGAAGAASGFFTRLLTQPLDVIKIRFQLQIESTYGINKGKYYGVFQALKAIGSQEGAWALWKGHVPCQLLTIFYGSGQFFFYFLCTKTYREYSKILNGTSQVACGGFSGAMGTIVSMPFDVARTRLIAQNKRQYTGTLNVWIEMYKKSGMMSLWRGLTPTLCMVVPSAAVQFRTYNLLNEFFTQGKPDGEFIGVWTSMFSGGVAGLAAKFAVYPLDVLKKRLQIMGSEDVRKGFGKVDRYRNPIDCVTRITTEEGLTAWYKGLMPSLIKSYAYSALAFSFFELCCQLIVTAENSKREGNT